MLKNVSPASVRQFCIMAGFLFFSPFALIAGIEIYTGEANVSQRRPLPNLSVRREENPSLYWAYVK